LQTIAKAENYRVLQRFLENNYAKALKTSPALF
jgi:hypothetical protein